MIRNRFLIALLISLAALMIVVAVSAGFVNHLAQKPIELKDDLTNFKPVTLYLPRGQGLLRASHLAHQSGAVGRPWHFQLVASVMQASTRLQAGEYAIKNGETLRQLINRMTRGDVMVRQLTVPEGYSSQQIIQLINEAPFLDVDDQIVVAEGILAPDTYFYHRGEKGKQLLERMQNAQSLIVDEVWADRPADFSLASRNQLLTLASIIEKETAISAERPIIAAVFLNRLKRGMRLQSDPTIIYGITGGLPLGRAIRRSDIRANTAYNTYRINGLPPTPIANPGAKAIRAVIQPADVDYLYFVADGTGGHVFAKTYAQHQKNVRKWRAIESAK